MNRWILSIPVWKERYHKVFASAMVPSLRIAARQTSLKIKLLIHTDDSERVGKVVEGFDVEFMSVPVADTWWKSLTLAHKQAFKLAGPMDCVMPLTADMVLSPETLAACERSILSGKKLVVCGGVRATYDGSTLDCSSSRALLKWGWEHRHPLTNEYTWPDGKADNWPGVYCVEGDNVVYRARYIHPLAAMAFGHEANFFPTVDAGYFDNYQQSEIHVVTDADELSVIKLSDPSKPLDWKGRPLGEWTAGMIRGYNGLMRWFLKHRIVICGTSEGVALSAYDETFGCG